MSDPIAACDRLIVVFERASELSLLGRMATDDSIRAPILRFAIAQLRMRVRVAFEPDWPAGDPVHITLFGGTNTGKSTVVNVLIGCPAAGMGVRARHSQHPEAYRPAVLGDRWLQAGSSRFLGYRQYRDEHPPRQSDEELRRVGYQPALALHTLDRLDAAPLAPAATTTSIVWDAPDFSTDQSSAYLSTVIDLLALADLVVMTVTDESYADDRATSLWKMVGEAGLPSLVVANKIPESQALLEAIKATLEIAGNNHAHVCRLPEVSGASAIERLERLLDLEETRRFRESVLREAEPGSRMKRRSLRGAIDFIDRHLDEFLGPLTHEVTMTAGWAESVARLTRECVLESYRIDYLETVNYGELNRTHLHLMSLLQVPLVGPILDVMGRLVRMPLKLIGRAGKRILGRPTDEPSRPHERAVLEAGMQTWIDALKAEAQVLSRSESGAVWTQVITELESDQFHAELWNEFGQAYSSYRDRMELELKRRAELLSSRLKRNPGVLAIMRGANLIVGATLVTLVVQAGGLDWSDACLGLLVVGLWQNLLEWGLGRYLETLRAELKDIQFQLICNLVEAHVERPVRNLLHGVVTATDLVEARNDFAMIKAEATRIAGGDGE